MKVGYWPGWYTMRVVEAEVLARSTGGFHLKIRYRCILGYKRTKWVTSDDIFDIEQKGRREMSEIARVTADQVREAARVSGIVLSGADVYAMADNLTAILLRDYSPASAAKESAK